MCFILKEYFFYKNDYKEGTLQKERLQREHLTKRTTARRVLYNKTARGVVYNKNDCKGSSLQREWLQGE